MESPHRFQFHRRAESVWVKYANINQFYTFLNFQDRCEKAPCPLEVRGIHIHWQDEVTLRMADYVVVHMCTEEQEVRNVIADPTENYAALSQEAPNEYMQTAMHWAQENDMDAQEIGRLADDYQATLTNEARSIYQTTNMPQLHNRQLMVYAAEIRDIEFWAIGHVADRDPFGLIYDLEDRRLISKAGKWKIVAIHQSIRDSLLSEDSQYIGILHHDDRPAEHLSLAFVEKIFYQNQKTGGKTLKSYHSIFFEEVFHGNMLIEDMRLQRVCHLHSCRLQVDGMEVSLEQTCFIRDGAFLQLRIRQREEDAVGGDKKVKEDVVQGEYSSDQLQEQAAAKRRRTSQPAGPSELHPPPGGDMVAGLFLGLALRELYRRNIMKEKYKKILPASTTRSTRWRLLLVYAMLATASGLQHLTSTPCRIGEASNPGPWWIGTTNPGGLRGKEWLYGELPSGIWGCSETHLTMEGIRQSNKVLSHVHHDRQLQLLHGAPAALRARSEDVGTWTGVGFITDLIPRTIHCQCCQWDNQEQAMGRVQLARFWWGQRSITGGNIYLWPRGPTWPKAVEASNLLLDQLTKELVLSRTGLRFITGDFNHDDKLLDCIEIWKQQGWVDAQSYAEETWNREITNTCKGKTVRDHIWLSPEFIPYITQVRTWDIFADHAAVGVQVDLPIQQQKERIWKMPAYVPWEDIQKEEWQQQTTASPTNQHYVDIDEQYKAFWQRYEDSFDGYMNSTVKGLPSAIRGRAQTMEPTYRDSQCPLLRPSRPGEVRMKHDGLGRSVQRWFLQLRRLQSLTQALHAGKSTASAQLYRASLWGSIKRSKGFEQGFEKWWTTRPYKLQGSPSELPAGVPGTFMADLIYQDYMDNYRRLEAWHARRRGESLKANLEANKYRIFSIVKPEPKGALQQLQETFEMNIIGVSEDGNQIQLDQPLQQGPACTFTVEDFPVDVHTDPSSAENEIYDIHSDTLLYTGQSIQQVVHYNTPEDIQRKLEDFWKKRWWKDRPPSEEDWQRIMSFGKAYLPTLHMPYDHITVEGWTEVNKRYGQKSARGPDGVARLDLQYMPDSMQEQLVDILNRSEAAHSWPQSAATGFVHALPKKDDAVEPGQFRPVIIYSMVYRSWSSYRAKQILRRVGQICCDRQYGFMPESDSTQVWVITQALLEHSVQRNEEIYGFVSDIQKAFENIPRIPVRDLALHLGVPVNIVMTWMHFLEITERRFVVRNQIGDPVKSNNGFPEGCAMSCAAMAIVDLTFHAYLQRFGARCKELSYVDNLEIFCRNNADLQQSILTIQTWADLWGLDLDKAKSYVWATTTQARKTLQGGQWRISEVEKDLGASIAYGKKSAKKLQTVRMDALDPLFEKLKRVNAPEWQKQVVLKQALWPRGLYGASISRVGWEQICKMRTAGSRALRYNRAGSAPAIRLFFLSHEQCDPGFYQLWTTWQVFRRVARERPFLRQLWSSFMQNYQGEKLQGPFTKLLELGAMTGWHINPPYITDHDGLQHHILDIDNEILYRILRNAWSQKISWDLKKRKDMHDLQGIDEITLRKDTKDTPNYKRKLLDALRDGSFLDAQVHRKYDNTKDGKCRLCGGEDSLEHRCIQCPKLEDIRRDHRAIVQEWPTLPHSLREHLLPSRNPWEQEFQLLIYEQKYKVTYDIDRSKPGEELHLFTDGSALSPEVPAYTVAAWAVVNATDDALVCSQPLEGLQQTNDHAEVEAVYHAVVAASISRRPTTIWTDSSVAGQGLQRMLVDPEDIPDGKHREQWLKVKEILDHLEQPLTVQHVAAHRGTTRLHGDVDDWTALWNNRADAEASRAHNKRPVALEQCRTRLLQHHREQSERLRALRELHWEVAEKYLQTPEYDFYQADEYDHGDDPNENLLRRYLHERMDDETAVQELIPTDWDDTISSTGLGSQFGGRFTREAVSLLMQEYANEDSRRLRISWLELAIFLIQKLQFILPLPSDRGNVWMDSHLSRNAGRLRPQTIAAVVRLARTFGAKLADAFDFRLPARAGINLAAARVHTPMAGCVIWFTPLSYSGVLSDLNCFTVRRPIRVVNDLARPLR